MKHLKKLAFVSGIGIGWWLYQQYQRDRVTTIKKFREGSQIAKLDVGQMEYVIEGDGTPMLCLHGGMGGYEQGLMLGQLLNYDHFQMIAPSRAGARGTPLNIGKTFADQATAYNQLLDHLKIEKAIVVGLSGGGLSALQFALDYPERCQALILLSAVSPLAAQRNVPEGAIQLLNLMMSSDFVMWIIHKLALNIIFRIAGTDSADFREGSMIHDMVANFFPSSDWRDNVMNDMKQIYGVKDFPFENVNVPTLVLHGDSDPITSLKLAEQTAHRIPNAKFIILSGGSHFMMAKDTELLHHYMKKFFSELKTTD